MATKEESDKLKKQAKNAAKNRDQFEKEQAILEIKRSNPAIYRIMIKQEREEKKQAKEIPKALAYAEVKASEALDELRKIGQLIDLCFELLPEAQRVSITQEMNNKTMSNVYVDYCYININRFFYLKKLLNGEITQFGNIFRNCGDIKSNELNNNIEELNCFSRWPFKGIYKFPALAIDYSDIDSDIKSINTLKKSNNYTAALTKTIAFIIKIPMEYIINIHLDCVSSDRFYSIIDFIGELFIDIGAINSALKLYDVDERLFNNLNTLSLLVSNSATPISL